MNFPGRTAEWRPGRTSDHISIAPDGAIWTIDGSAAAPPDLDVGDALGSRAGTGARLSLVGNEPFVVDPANRRARLGDGDWQSLDGTIDPSEFVIQRPGPSADCGWIGANDDLWCVASDGIDERATVDGLDIDGSDFLAIAGDAAAVVRRAPAEIVRFDWRTGETLDDVLTIDPDEQLDVSATVDLVWVDDVAGDQVWAVNPWGVNAIDKNGDDIFVVGEDGNLIDQGDVDDVDAALDRRRRRAARSSTANPTTTASTIHRSPSTTPSPRGPGSSVAVQVTANDYDPDGEAVAISAVGLPGHGTVEIGTASTIVYTPEAGYVGATRSSTRSSTATAPRTRRRS